MPKAKHSRDLHRAITVAAQASFEVAEAFVERSPLRRSYPEYLFRTHCIARATVPLLQAAIARTRALRRQEPVAAGLHGYLERHIAEEERHARWLLEDLEILGHDQQRVLARVPPPSIAAGVGAQYYWIEHAHPIALAGYMAVLEGGMASPEVIERLIERSRLPRRAFRTLLVHADADRHHSRDLDALLDRLPLSREHRTLLHLSALATVQLVRSLFDEVVRIPHSRPQRSAEPRPRRSVSSLA